MTNEEFLRIIFGESYVYAHVTSFPDDPTNISADRRPICWAGGYYQDTPLTRATNQFYTISLFAPIDGRSKRRKATFSSCHVIGLDDVKEKLPLEQVNKLPKPTIVLQSSMYSEQWLYVLAKPCANKSKVENLLDGLIAKGLAPDSKDPGMKGVTRYLRLPEGVNNKASRIAENGGEPFQCKVLEYNPFHKYSLEQLAKPFDVDLSAKRREGLVDGSVAIPDHPILQVPDLVHVKEDKGEGRFDITCPWVDQHTDMDDSGSAVFTNKDGSMGFKCHHGGCQDKTGRDVLNYIEKAMPGFMETYKGWKLMRTIMAPEKEGAPIFKGEEPEIPKKPDSTLVVKGLVRKLKQLNPSLPEARELAVSILKAVDDMSAIDKLHWHDSVSDTMGWSKLVLKAILKDARAEWYMKEAKTKDFFKNVLWVRGLNQFYDFKCNQFFTAEAFQNSFSDKEEEARKMALQEGHVTKVDRLDYAPGEELVFTHKGVVYGNTWQEEHISGKQGDVSAWLEHFNVLGWEEHIKHVLQWMAYTVLHPEIKINHMLMMGSGEGAGKDFLLYPLLKAMGRNGMVVSGEELMDGFNDYLLTTKYLHFNEVDLGDSRMAKTVGNRLKPIAAAPPATHRVNSKGVKRVEVRNIVNGTLTTNARQPLEIVGVSRRYYAMWTDFTTRDEDGNTIPKWNHYWQAKWKWMTEEEGADACVWYLRNCVDLSDFAPGAPPPMTDFLRDIAYASQSPGVQSLIAFIEAKAGCFKSDLVTAMDVSATMQAGDLVCPEGMFADRKIFTPQGIGRMLGEMHGCMQKRAKLGKKQERIWVVRNAPRYANMNPTQLYETYTMNKAPSIKHQLRVVK